MGDRLRSLPCRAATLAALLLASAGVTACGASKSTAGAAAKTASTGAAGAAGATPKPLSDSQAAAFARAVNLTAADLPGWTETAAAKVKRSRGPSDHRLRACLGVASAQVPEYKSARFSRRNGAAGEDVKSSIEIVASPSEAAAEAARLRSARAISCLRQVAPALEGSTTVHFGHFVISRLPAPAAAKGSYALRVTTAVSRTGSSLSLPVYIDEYGVAAGRAELGVNAIGLSHPVPAATAEALLAKLAQRAATHTP